MGKLTKDQLAEQAAGYFEKYPFEKTFFATSDGMFFTADSRAYAVDHQRAGDHTLHVFTREVKTVEAEESDPTNVSPDMKWSKEMIQNFLDVKGIEYAASETKAQLLEKLNKEE